MMYTLISKQKQNKLPIKDSGQEEGQVAYLPLPDHDISSNIPSLCTWALQL